MKQENPRFTRAALLCAAALMAAPAVAQDTTTAAPPAAAAAPPAAPVAPPTVVPTIDRDSSTNVTGGKTTSPTPVNPEAAAQAAAEDAQRRTATRTASRPAARPVAARPAPVRTAAPVAEAAPASSPFAAPAPAPAPVAAAPLATPAAPVADQPAAPAEATAPAATQADTVTTETTATKSGGSSLPWIILGVLVIAGLAAALLFRRRRAAAEVYEQPIYAEPVYEPAIAPVAERTPVAPVDPVAPVAAAPVVSAVTEPVDVAPATADDATIEEPAAADVAALTAGGPAGDRPWLELAMRPIRAGTNVDEALVEIELTVGNAGTIQADDVRISTFMLPAGSDGEMDRLLTQSRVDASVEPLSIAAGEGTRIDATLALSRAELMANEATTFQPVVVADARYRLPDGSEGRTSASFIVGIASDGELGLLELDRPVLRDDVEARLYREPARV